jgi:monovalent cation:H+ antiporter-2, CPA2 family
MHESQLIITLTGALAAALILGYVTYRVGLSPIVGYLLAGLVVGPYTPGFVADGGLTGEFAELGVILLMFGIGLHFHLKGPSCRADRRDRRSDLPEHDRNTVGCFAARGLGWSWGTGIVFGLALSVASTVVLTRVLVDNNDLHTQTGRVAIGWLVVEDIFTVLVLVLLPLLANSSGSPADVAAALGLALVKIALLVILAFVLGSRIIPWILNRAVKTHSRELFTLPILVLILGIAVGSATLFGASMALGAFLAGMIIGQSEFSLRAASEALPMRDAFAVLFFVSVGMLFDPGQLLQAPGLLLSALAVILIGKPAAAFLIVTILGFGSRTALRVSAALSQIGEFSLILAAVADQTGIFPAGPTNVLVAASMMTITINPILYRLAGPLESALARRASLWRLLNPSPHIPELPQIDTKATRESHLRTVVVGYGPIGRTLARLLKDGGIEPVVIETNLDSVRSAREEGYTAVYGDAGRKDVIESAGIRTAIGLVVAGPPAVEVAEIIRVARILNPTIHVLARSYYLRDADALRKVGATEVFSGEGEVALAMSEHILAQLGATPEQMDRERQRVRDEVFRAG